MLNPSLFSKLASDTTPENSPKQIHRFAAALPNCFLVAKWRNFEGEKNRCSTQTERPSVETAEATQQETERGYLFKYSSLLADVYSAKLHRCRYKLLGSGFGFGRAKRFLKQTWDSFKSGIKKWDSKW
jgi:hypothetical protein